MILSLQTATEDLRLIFVCGFDYNAISCLLFGLLSLKRFTHLVERPGKYVLCVRMMSSKNGLTFVEIFVSELSKPILPVGPFKGKALTE